MLLELAAHLESKAAQLKWEGLSEIKVALVIRIFPRTEYFLCRDKLLPVFKHGFLRSEENVHLAILYTQKCVSENVFQINIFLFHNGRCYAIC